MMKQFYLFIFFLMLSGVAYCLVYTNKVVGAKNEALKDEQKATVQYSLDKTLKNKWNFIVGTQFQINRHFMIRAEYGFLGSRQQFIGGLQYRFGL